MERKLRANVNRKHLYEDSVEIENKRALLSHNYDAVVDETTAITKLLFSLISYRAHVLHICCNTYNKICAHSCGKPKEELVSTEATISPTATLFIIELK